MSPYLSNDFNMSEYADVADECCIWSAPFGLKLLDCIDYRRGITVLDIGSGTGFPVIEIAMRLGEGSRVFGIDPWPEAIERAKRKISYCRLQNVALIEGQAESIPLDNASVDLVTSNNGLNNVKDPEKAMSEISRIMKPGGQFIQTMNTDKTMFEFYTEMGQVLSELGMEEQLRQMYRHIYDKRRPLDEMISSVKSNGFLIKDVEQDQFCYKFADATAMLNHYFIRLAFMNSWISLLPEDSAGKVFRKIESALNEQAQKLGGMKLSVPFVLINAVKE